MGEAKIGEQCVLVSAYSALTERIMAEWQSQGFLIESVESAEALASWVKPSAGMLENTTRRAVVISPELPSVVLNECEAVLRSVVQDPSNQLTLLVIDGADELSDTWMAIIGDSSLSESVKQAVQQFQGLKPVCVSRYYGIQLSTLSPDELSVKLAVLLNYPQPEVPTTFAIDSFGYKYGAPTDAHWVFDARFVPNPYYQAELRELTGNDQPVKDFMTQYPCVNEAADHWLAMLTTCLPTYSAQGKRDYRIAIGCTGGQHRSVYLAHRLQHLIQQAFPNAAIKLSHREQNRWPKPVYS